MDGSKVGEFGKVGKLEHCRTDEEMRSQSEERLRKSIIKGLTRRNREKTRDKTSYAWMTSPARSCRGTQYVKLGN